MRPEASQTPAPFRVLVHGLPYFGRMFAEMMSGDEWDFRFYPDEGIGNYAALAWHLGACNIVYQIGGRVTVGKFLWAARQLKKSRIVMHWAGSDTLDERGLVALGKTDIWVKEQVSHWAESDWMVKEVEELGLSCEQVPLPSAVIPEQPASLPQVFSVLVHVPSVQLGLLYGLDRILRVADSLPEIRFEMVGLKSGSIPNAPANLAVHGRVADLSTFYKRACVVWRPVRHDGLSFMVREALGYGRHVLYTYAFPGCVQVQDAEDAGAELLRLFGLHQRGQLRVNEAGMRVVAERYEKKRVRQAILCRLANLLEHECPRAER